MKIILGPPPKTATHFNMVPFEKGENLVLYGYKNRCATKVLDALTISLVGLKNTSKI